MISKNVKILDSPGIVMADPILKNNTVLCLKNLVRADKLQDPVQAAQAILVRATKEQVNFLPNNVFLDRIFESTDDIFSTDDKLV